MNRRERRAAVARGESSDPPEKCVRTIDRMIVELRAWFAAHPGECPRFVLPPLRINVIAPLDAVRDVVGFDLAARELIDRFCAIGVEIQGPGAEPTITMLRAAIEIVGLTYATAPLEAFGKYTVLSRGSSAGN